VAARTPRMLAQALTRCLAKRPDHRPPSARALAQVFHALAAQHEAEFSAEARAAWWATFTASPPEPAPGAEPPSPLAVRLDTAHSLRRRSA
jgi:hypothetical protein